MASTLSSFDFALKERYTKKKVEDLTSADRPFLAMVNKNEDFQGDALNVPLIDVNPQGIAGDALATAQTNASNLGGKKFQLTVGDYYGTVSVGDKVIEASRGQEGAFLRNRLAETDGLYTQMADNLAKYCYGNGGNAIGTISSISTDTVTLTEASDIINFEVGMELVVSADDGSDAGDSLRTGSSTVTAVDREAGTFDWTSSEITGETAGDSIFRQGDFFGDTGTVILNGLGSFITATSSPAALYGMTRTSDPSRLAGIRVPSADISGRNIEERIQILGSHMVGRHKGPGADKAFMNPEDWQNLAIALGSRAYIKNDTSTRWGFLAIEMVFGGRVVKIYPDRYCPKGTMFALRMENWTLHSMRKLIHPINGDGLMSLRASTANDYEYRLVSYPGLCTNAPGWSGRLSLT